MGAGANRRTGGLIGSKEPAGGRGTMTAAVSGMVWKAGSAAGSAAGAVALALALTGVGVPQARAGTSIGPAI